MALKEIESENFNKSIKDSSKKEPGIALTSATRLYTIISGISTVAVGYETFLAVADKLNNVLPFALNLGVGAVRGLVASVATAGVAVAIGAGTLYGAQSVGQSLKNKREKNQIEMGFQS